MSFNKVLFLVFFFSCTVFPRIITQSTSFTTGDSVSKGTKWGAPQLLDTEVNIEVENVTLKGALEFLEKKYQINFVYDSKLVNKGNVSLSIENKPLEDVLAELFEGTDISYVSIDNKIIIAKKQSIEERTGAVKGKVTSQSGEPLIAANVIILENNFGAATDEDGNYVIKNLKPGSYTLSVSYIGFEGTTQKVEVFSGRTTEINIVLESTSFNIGGIEVVGSGDFMPLDPETKTEVTSGEIEHMQAASLGDVLQFMPGLETQNPTLGSVTQAKIRGREEVGTQVIVDGVPISNTANLQANMIKTTAGQGIDLRSIPAENIESVEIIRGVPSVKYGDLVDGAIIVKSKAIPSPLRFKTKYNPRVYEANLSGGYRLSDKWVLNGNVNVAYSNRNVRVDGDSYTRLATQLNSSYDTETLGLKNSVYFTRTYDEMKEQPGYASRDAWYNRDIIIKYIGEVNYLFNSLSQLNATFSVNFTKRNSFNQELISRDNLVLSDRMEEGAQEGTFIFGSYLGQEWVKGAEWNLYADLNYEYGFYTGEFLHKFLAGVNWKDDFNNGDGYIFDPLHPIFYGYSTPRLRSYDDIPAFQTISFYLEDKIAGRLFRPFTLQFGFRYESYRPNGFNLEGLWGNGDFIDSHNGTYFNPRINFSYDLFENTQLRVGYGVTSKAPYMSMIFAQDEYVDIVDTNLVVDPNDPSANFSIVSTYIYKNTNQNLKGTRQYKYEASIDQVLGPVGASLTGYINKTKEGFSTNITPSLLYKKSFPDWPNQNTYSLKDTIFYSYSEKANNAYYTSKGFEFSLKTKKIPVINTIFKFDASYMEFKYFEGQNFILGTERTAAEFGGRVQALYSPKRKRKENLLLNYRFDIQAKSLGMWITVHIQQNIFDKYRYTDYDSLAIGYYNINDEMVIIPEEDRNNPEYEILRRSIQPFEYDEEKEANVWLVNLKVSKSLWEGAAISFFVNNFLNNNPLYRNRSSDSEPNYTRSNPEIFYGMEFQTSL